MRLAEIMASCVERTAQRANRAGIGGTRRHILGLETNVRKYSTESLRDFWPAAFRLARNVVLAVGRICDQRRGGESNDQRHERRQRLRRRSEQTIERADRDDSGDRHRARRRPD